MSQSGATAVTYFALVTRALGEGFVVRFPDFPDCVIRRLRLDQVFSSAKEAVHTHVDIFVRHGKQLPRPTPLEEFKNNPENRSSFLLKFEIEIPGAMAPDEEVA